MREFIKSKENLEEDITNNAALELTANKVFVDLLKKAERIEFAKSSADIDVSAMVKNLRKEFEKGGLKDEE